MQRARLYQPILTVSGALVAERIMGLDASGCRHTAKREDASINLKTLGRMLVDFANADVVLIESANDNLLPHLALSRVT